MCSLCCCHLTVKQSKITSADQSFFQMTQQIPIACEFWSGSVYGTTLEDTRMSFMHSNTLMGDVKLR